MVATMGLGRRTGHCAGRANYLRPGGWLGGVEMDLDQARPFQEPFRKRGHIEISASWPIPPVSTECRPCGRRSLSGTIDWAGNKAEKPFDIR